MGTRRETSWWQSPAGKATIVTGIFSVISVAIAGVFSLIAAFHGSGPGTGGAREGGASTIVTMTATTTSDQVRSVLIEPQSGPSGTPIHVSGDPCRTVPKDRKLGGIALGITRDSTTLSSSDIGLTPGQSWSASLRIPPNTPPGAVAVYADCKAFDPTEPGHPWTSYGDDRSGSFKVTDG